MGKFPLSAAPTPSELARIGFQLGVALELVDGAVLATFSSFNAVTPLFIVEIRPASGASFAGVELDDFVLDVGVGLAALLQYWDKRVEQPDQVAPLMLDDLLPQAMARYPTLSVSLRSVLTRDAASWLG